MIGRCFRGGLPALGVLGIALAVLGAVVFHARLADLWHSWNDRDNLFPPDALVDYTPEDSAAIVVVNVRSLLASPAGRRLTPSLRLLVREGQRRLRWMEWLGINPFDDLDSLRISFAARGAGQPLWLARGRWDRSRFAIGPQKLQETKLARFRVLEYVDDESRRTTLLALMGEVLVAGETSARVSAALEQAQEPQPLVVRDESLRELLAEMDRRQDIWLAASLDKLGSNAAIEGFWPRLILRPVLAHADSVHGGVTCTDDVSAEVFFHSSSEEKAKKLEKALQDIRDLAHLLNGQAGKDLRPLLRLLGAGDINRENQNVSLRCRLTLEQWNE